MSQKITQEVVNQIAEQLASSGQNVTIDAVRQALGFGSFTTISPLVKSWKEANIVEAAAVEAMPAEAERAAAEAARVIWSAAQRAAAERIEAARAQADDAVREAVANADEAVAEVGRLEADLRDMTEKHEWASEKARDLEKEVIQVTSAKDAAESRLAEIKADAATAREDARDAERRAATAEGRAASAEQQQAKIEAKLEQVQQALADERAARQK